MQQFRSPSDASPLGAAAPSALPAPAAARMERAFGADFSGVRAHEGGQAAAIGAEAFARGEDVHFGAGAYGAAGGGQELLGHELAHVVQQRAGLYAGQY